MKLRTSLCNPTALKKDITRFAPSWVLYSVGLFLMLSIIFTGESDYSRASALADSLVLMAMINIVYAFINGQLLFGDLFSTRNCNALHAMPLRRECWYGTHVIAGMLFSFVPNLVFAALMMPMLGTGILTAGYWLAGVTLQYLFFFGLAVFSALCVGNRFAMVLVYSIINFFAMIIYWFYYSLYEPLLYGVQLDETLFLPFCPVVQMCRNYDLLQVQGQYTVSYYHRAVEQIVLGEGWGYLAISAAIGVGLMALSLFLYRRRKLESAGDFMAVKVLEPVFLILYTLCMAALFQLISEMFGEMEFLFLLLGLAVGFFTGRMLLMRTTRVFQPKGFLWFVIFVVAFAASMFITSLDPLGITRYIPETQDVKRVTIADYNPSYANNPYMSDPADIDAVREMHQMILDGKGEVNEAVRYTNVYILYEMKDGITVKRNYTVAVTSEPGRIFGSFSGRADFILGTTDPAEIVDNLKYLYYSFEPQQVSGTVEQFQGQYREQIYGLLEAIMADCREGHMNQQWDYREEDAVSVGWIDIEYTDAEGRHRSANITIFSDAVHTIEYMNQNPLPITEYYG